jgi:hypothetical protein
MTTGGFESVCSRIFKSDMVYHSKINPVAMSFSCTPTVLTLMLVIIFSTGWLTNPKIVEASVPGVPGTPVFSNVTASGMRINWSAASEAVSYKIERCSGVNCTSYTQIASGVTAFYYNDNSLSSNISYTYRIRATNSGGDGAYSDTGTQIANPGVPTCFVTVDVSPIAYGNSTTLRWASANTDTSFFITNVGYVAPNASGSATVAPLASTAYNGSAIGVAGTTNCNASLTVSPIPDLASAVSISGTMGAGNTLTFTGTVSNEGAAMTTSNSHGFIKIGEIRGTNSDRGFHSVVQAGNQVYVAVIAAGNGTLNVEDIRIFDVTSPSSPIKIGGLNWHNCSVEGFTKIGPNMLAGSHCPEAINRFSIINVGVPTAPTIVVRRTVSGGSVWTAPAVSGNYAYLGTDVNISVFDISNLNAPVQVSTTTLNRLVRGLEISGNYAYVAVQDTLPTQSSLPNLYVYDISNPSSLVQVASLKLAPNTSYSYAMTILGKYLYVATDSNLFVVDISNPALPSQVFAGAIAARGYSVTVKGMRLFIATEFSGVQIYDIGNQANPVYIGNMGVRDPIDANVNRFYGVDISDTVGYATRFSATVVTGGSARLETYAPRAFTRFCIDNANCLTTTTGRLGGKDYDIGLLEAGGSSATSSTWVATAGSHTIYFCSDVGRGVSESNEVNNCTSSVFTIAPPPTCTLAVNPTSVLRGQSSVLSWTSTNATSCVGDNFSTGGLAYGNVSMSPTASTVYTASCTGTAGTSQCTGTGSGGIGALLTVTCPLSWACTGAGNQTIRQTNTDCSYVDLAPSCVLPQFCSNGASICLNSTRIINQHLKVTPRLVHKGRPVTLSWNIGNVIGCTVSGNGQTFSGLTNSAAITNPVTGLTTFTLTCLELPNGATSFSESQTVNIAPGYTES